MGGLFQTYIYLPILSVLGFIYEHIVFHDLGFAIILLTLLIRVVLYPLFYKGAKDQALMQLLQPHIKKIQLDHKDNKEIQAKELMALYKKYRLNPFSGFLTLLLQLPIFIALFQVFSKGLGGQIFDNHTLLGLINLGETSIVLALLAAFLQYVQGKLSLVAVSSGKTQGGDDPLRSTGKTMMIVGPVITVVVLFRLPAALGLYWVTSTLFSIMQQWFINKRLPDISHELKA